MVIRARVIPTGPTLRAKPRGRRWQPGVQLMSPCSPNYNCRATPIYSPVYPAFLQLRYFGKAPNTFLRSKVRHMAMSAYCSKGIKLCLYMHGREEGERRGRGHYTEVIVCRHLWVVSIWLGGGRVFRQGLQCCWFRLTTAPCLKLQQNQGRWGPFC